jgi:hypothetical protein
MHYGEFIRALAMRVARAAREGDIMGVGGELVSANERRFIERLDSLIQAPLKKNGSSRLADRA